LHSESPILVVHEVDRGRSAKRFVAALCFMEFYAYFVGCGNSIWHSDGNYYGNLMWSAITTEWSQIPLFVGTAFLYLCGRGLWVGGRHEGRWLWLGILGLFAVMILDATAATIDSANSSSLTSLMGYASLFKSSTIDAYLDGLQAAFTHIPLWSSLVALWLVTRPKSRSQRSTKALWVYCAAAYCLAWIPAAMFRLSLVRSVFDYGVNALTNVDNSEYAAIAIYTLLLSTTIILLLRGSRRARSLGLIIATVNTVAVWNSWFVISWLVSVSIKGLSYRIPFSTPTELPDMWTRHDFFWLFVLPAHYILPWLLIAYYAWRVPMRKPPEDDTPFPRRYCAKCLYRLYEKKSDRCPECGSVLTARSCRASNS
jgi:hypothetical protein